MTKTKRPPVRPVCPADFVPLHPSLVETSVPAAFEAMAEKYPNNPAVTCDGFALTYRELDEQANALANRILAKVGAGKEPVAILCAYSAQAIVAVMGTLKSGRPYIGLDLSFPTDRMKQILSDSGTRLLIADQANREIATEIAQGKATLAMESDEPPDTRHPGIQVAPTDLTVIYYTSGSTGKPKGVAWSHGQMLSNSIHQVNQLYIGPSDRRGMFAASIAFASSRSPIFDTVFSGSAICMYEIKTKGAAPIAEWLSSERITIISCSAPVLRTIFSPLPEGLIFPAIRVVTLGGQAPTAQDAALFRNHTPPTAVLGNHFASTEAGIVSNYLLDHNTPIEWEMVPAAQEIFADKELLLLNEDGEQVPTGETGEIVIRSRYLSAGYLNEPELTAQKFLRDPHDPQLITFHTGDLGRWHKNGYLEHLGRKDFVVKIRGYNIQLDLIDAALKNVAGIRDAVTIAYQPGEGNKRLVAYILPAQADRPTVAAIRQALAAKLQEYMIPSAFLWLDEFPRTAAGKVNRGQLPPPSGVRPEIGAAYVAPRNELEEQIAAIWQTILGFEQVGVEDNFFELGGDSLQALDMAVKVERLTHKTMPLTFFENPTIAHLNGLVAGGATESEWRGARGRAGGEWRPRKKRSARDVVERNYSSRDLTRLVGWLVGKWVLKKSYVDGNRWLSWWARQPLAKYLYRAEVKQFIQFVESIEGHNPVEPGMVERNLFGNLAADMRIAQAHEWDLSIHYLDRLRRSPNRYWRDMVSVIEQAPDDEFARFFEYIGLEHLERSQNNGKGVIIVSYHSLGSHSSMEGLARKLKIDAIPTISQNQGGGSGSHESVTILDSARFARTALQAQHLLEQGKIVQLVSDFDYGKDGQYRAILCHREYHLKLGFADLALHTGAPVIPKVCWQDADGKIVTVIHPPFSEGQGSREERALHFAQQYIDFINASWREVPESVRWSRIVRHYRQPATG